MNQKITSTKNEFVKFAKRLKVKKGRSDSNAFLVEGEKCVQELMTHMPDSIQSVVVLEDEYCDIISDVHSLGRQIYHVTDNVMKAICDCKTPQGIAAVANMPAYKHVSTGFILALDDVQDPQNVGTMIRTADAAGCSSVVLSHNSADCFSPKAVRASMGSIFHIPVLRVDLREYIGELLSLDYQIASAHLLGQTDYCLDWNKTCLVIGNESKGVSEDIQMLSTKRIKIPMYGKAESLNAAVAAGILIYKIRT